jgi:hypothetical protein
MNDDLVSLMPNATRDLPPDARTTMRADLFRAIEQEPQAPVPRIRRRATRRRATLAAVLLPAALLGGALAYSASRSDEPPVADVLVTCHQSLNVDSASAGAPFTGQDLGAFCNERWVSGAITYPVTDTVPAHWIACAGTAGGADLFPAADDSQCATVGLRPLSVNYYASSRRFSSMQREIRAILAKGCLSPQDATEQVTSVLGDRGFSSWTVESSLDSSSCVTEAELSPSNGSITLASRQPSS